MEYSALGLEHFSPDYTHHFYHLDEAQKAAQLQQQALLYKGISAKTIGDIYTKLYQHSIAGAKQQTFLHSQSNLIHAEVLNQQIRLIFEHKVTTQQFYLDANVVVAATGYQTPRFDFMHHLHALIQTDAQGHWKITEDYRLKHKAAGEIYVQNQEMHSHGVGTPDLGLGAHRAAKIINQLLGYALYELSDQQQCFQSFKPEQNPYMQLLSTSAQAMLRHGNSSINPVKPSQPNAEKHLTQAALPLQKLEKIL